MKLKYALSLMAAGMLMCSCTTKRNLTYFEDIETIQPLAVNADYVAKIEPGDELIITVTSPANQSATSIYNLPMANPSVYGSLMEPGRQPQQQTYEVSPEGDIIFPVIGKIKVEGMTCDELRKLLVKRIEVDVPDPVVKVEIANFYVNVAGEVRTPMRIKVTQPRFSVLDAITSAGDLTTYGMRDNVLIIREENGVKKSQRLNLNSAESLASPYYYLKQNDYVYVEPSKTRQENAEYDQNNSYRLSVVSTIVSGCSVLVSLIVAITR